MDHLRAALQPSAACHHPLEADRVRLGRVGAVDQDEVGVPDVTPVVGHGPPAERGGQTDHRGTVSNTGLLLEVHHAERRASAWWRGSPPRELNAAPPAKAMPSQRFTTLPSASWVTNVRSRDALMLLGQLVEREVPGDLLPLRRAGRAVERASPPGGGTRRAACDVAPFGHSRPSLTGLSGSPSIWSSSTLPSGVLLRVREERAADRAVRADRVGHLRPLDAEGLLDLDRGGDVEAQGGDAGGAGAGDPDLQEISARDFLHVRPPCARLARQSRAPGSGASPAEPPHRR